MLLLSDMESLRGATVVFIGRPGSGKGTQSELLAVACRAAGLSAVRVTLGDVGRTLALKKTLIGEWVNKMMDAGEPFPSWLAFSLLVEALSGALTSADQVLILDGAPRRLFEAQALEELMKDIGRSTPRAVHLDISAEESRARLALRAREDDTESGIAKRLAWFETEVAPVISYYATRCVEVAGTGDPKEIHQAIQTALA